MWKKSTNDGDGNYEKQFSINKHFQNKEVN
jgi:hypothetical protein